MKGEQRFLVRNKRIEYDIKIKRKITIIKGNSGTGKTNLVSMASAYQRFGKGSGVHVSGSAEPVVLEDEFWRQRLSEWKNKIILIDEHARFVNSKEFAAAICSSDNYFVIISRSGCLKNLSYSVDEIYEMKALQREGRYLNVLEDRQDKTPVLQRAPDVYITEDSNAGREMVSLICDCCVLSAGGNGNVVSKVRKQPEGSRINVFVDGAAFGCFIDELLVLQALYDLYVFAPESFEYLLLRTKGFIRYVKEEVGHTENFCDTVQYLTWEQYYTDLLCKVARDKYDFVYTKAKLPEFFKTAAVLEEMGKVFIKW